jgi:hypothetical protein
MGNSITIAHGLEEVTCKYEAVSSYGFNAMPSIFQQQIAFDDYDGEADTFISASKFASPPKSTAMGILARSLQKSPPPIRDLSMASWLGSAAHTRFENAPVTGYTHVCRESRYNLMIPGNPHGVERKISGKFDLLFQKSDANKFFISDYKTEKAWATTFDSPHHALQLSINRMLLTLGVPAEGMSVEDTLKFVKLFAANVEDILAGMAAECPKSELWRFSKFYGHKRCAFYCDGRTVCPQFAAQLAGLSVTQPMLKMIGMLPNV